METNPNSATDPRPGGHPACISSACPDCGASLVLLDALTSPPLPANQVWYDEWTFPKCQDGIFLDWLPGAIEEDKA